MRSEFFGRISPAEIFVSEYFSLASVGTALTYVGGLQYSPMPMVRQRLIRDRQRSVPVKHPQFGHASDGNFHAYQSPSFGVTGAAACESLPSGVAR
jgi:hypothetical protein